MPTSFGVGYDGLQPVAGRVRLNVVPLFIGDPAGQTTIGGFDGAQHRLVERLDLWMTLDYVRPPLIGQLHGAAIGVLDCGTNRHAEPFPLAPLACAPLVCLLDTDTSSSRSTSTASPPNAADSRRAASARGL